MTVSSPTGNIFADAAFLASHAYDSTPAAAEALGWQSLTAADLGIDATGSFAAGTHAFDDGIYVGTDEDNSATAYAYVGELHGETTLALAFRGTDETGDLPDHLHFTDHYAKFEPLIAATQSYVDDPNHAIDKVLITGHSLGSAMVATAMIEEGWLGDPKYLGVAIAAHGADASVAATAPADSTNLVNFTHTQDFLVLGKEDGLPASAIGDLLDATAPIGGEADFEPKARVGTEIWIETGNVARLVADGTFEDPITAEHRVARYEADITTLAQNQELQPEALQASSDPRYFAVGTDEADNLVQDLFGSESLNEELFPTKDFDQRMYAGAGDDNVAGSGGDDFIDGGSGGDSAHYRGAAAEYAITHAGDVTTVTHASPGTGPSDGMDTLVNVETLDFADSSRPVDEPFVTLAGVGDPFDHIFG
jgi:hypothetical protein